MRKTYTVEYNTYGLENPARGRHKEAQRLFQDIYFFVSDTISIKKRIIGGKERISIDTVKLRGAGLEVISHEIYRPGREDEQLRRRLEDSTLTHVLESPGLVVGKNRITYDFMNDVKFQFTLMDISGHSGTHLSISGDSIDRVASLRDYFGFNPEGYMNISEYLRAAGLVTLVLQHPDSLERPFQS